MTKELSCIDERQRDRAAAREVDREPPRPPRPPLRDRVPSLTTLRET